MELNKTFEMSGKGYRCDGETLRVLRGVVDSYRNERSKDPSAVAAVMHLGLDAGRIVRMDPDPLENAGRTGE